ncbi:LmeA family phospholipid-binding protein [Gordonia rhizosphera]|uniref:DUF2993 domain-containing protein n=1 Tax=Gordonia rhizosphera NBRC 16068 TaxID=1108045 RepID=K6W9P8_9ACTN|nr:LmeA family phospholipid-binding protein [Gordonia rhizosphera]GAB88932.1 hypothetical protein GORHZ_046_00820 [Gordonia rhizosphera NBRC 16068]
MTDSEKPGSSETGGDEPQHGGDGDPTARLQSPPTDETPRAYSQSPRVPTRQFDETPTPGYYPMSDGFEPIPTGAQPGVVASSPAKRNTGKIIGAIAALAVVLLVIGAVGSELYLRSKTENCLESAFSDLTGTQTTVSLSRKPILLQGFGKDIPYVQVDTKDQPGEMRLHARAENITGDGDSATIGSLVGTGYVPFDRVVAMSNSSGATQTAPGNGTGQAGGGLMSGASIESMSGDGAAGTIEVNSTVQVAILPIPVSTTLKPVVQDGRVHFEVVKASAFIFGIPANFAQQVVDSVTGSMFGSFFDEVTVENLTVTDQGVDFAVDGSDVALAGGLSGGPDGCSV